MPLKIQVHLQNHNHLNLSYSYFICSLVYKKERAETKYKRLLKKEYRENNGTFFYIGKIPNLIKTQYFKKTGEE